MNTHLGSRTAQIDLLHARSTDAASSHEAAVLNRDGERESQIIQVCEVLEKYANLTSAEVALRGDIERHVAGRRMSDAERRGLIVRNESLRRCTLSGRNAITWRLR